MGLAPQILQARENPAGSRMERKPDYGEKSQIIISIPSKNGWTPQAGKSQELEFEGEGREKGCGTIRKRPSRWGEVELGALE